MRSTSGVPYATQWSNAEQSDDSDWDSDRAFGSDGAVAGGAVPRDEHAKRESMSPGMLRKQNLLRDIS